MRIAEKIASNSPTAVQAVKRAVQLGEGHPTEQAIAIMMEAHWRSAVHPDRVDGIGAFNENRDPTLPHSPYRPAQLRAGQPPTRRLRHGYGRSPRTGARRTLHD